MSAVEPCVRPGCGLLTITVNDALENHLVRTATAAGAQRLCDFYLLDTIETCQPAVLQEMTVAVSDLSKAGYDGPCGRLATELAAALADGFGVGDSCLRVMASAALDAALDGKGMREGGGMGDEYHWYLSVREACGNVPGSHGNQDLVPPVVRDQCLAWWAVLEARRPLVRAAKALLRPESTAKAPSQSEFSVDSGNGMRALGVALSRVHNFETSDKLLFNLRDELDARRA